MKDAHGITIDISVPILKGRDGYQGQGLSITKIFF